MPFSYARETSLAAWPLGALVMSVLLLAQANARAAASTIGFLLIVVHIIAFPVHPQRSRGRAWPVSLRDQRPQQAAPFLLVPRRAASQPPLQRAGRELVVARLAPRLFHRRPHVRVRDAL